MFDLKVLNSALEQLSEERGISRDKVIEAIEQALAAAYKKEYGKKGQIVRATFDSHTGKVDFVQVKIVVDETTVRMPEEDEDKETTPHDSEIPAENTEEVDLRPRFNTEHHILIEDARRIKKNATPEDEIVFPLEVKEDYGRIAAQTAKQVIIQKIREAEKFSILGEFGGKKGEVVSGVVQRIDRGNVFVDLGRTVGILPGEEQIPGERYRQGGRIKAYVLDVSEGPRGINIRLSRSHPDLIMKLFAVEAPEVASGAVEIKHVAREPGARSKIAVVSHDTKIDPIGACVGGRGIRVSTVMNELAGEKIDIIEWSEDPAQFVAYALSPAKVVSIKIHPEERRAEVTVSPDQFSLAIGKGGQNVRLAARLTGFRIDIAGAPGETVSSDVPEEPTDIAVGEELRAQEIVMEEILERKEHTPENEETEAMTPEAAEKELAEVEKTKTGEK